MCKVNEIRVLNTILNENFECPKIKKKQFKRGEVITSYIENRKQICVLLSGKAELIRTDFNGDEATLEYFLEGQLFGELFYSITSNTQLNVIAKEESEVIFVNYDFLSKQCSKNCKNHDPFIELFFSMISNRVIELTDHIELLTKKSIRDKLLAYFSTLSFEKSSSTFKLPLSLTALATYLNIDRSAMMREIKNLIEDGIIKKEKNKITLKRTS